MGAVVGDCVWVTMTWRARGTLYAGDLLSPSDPPSVLGFRVSLKY